MENDLAKYSPTDDNIKALPLIDFSDIEAFKKNKAISKKNIQLK